MIRFFKNISKSLKYSSFERLANGTLCNNIHFLPRKIPRGSVARKCLQPYNIQHIFLKNASKFLVRRIPRTTFGGEVLHINVRLFHTSEKRGAIPPLVLLALRPVAKLAAIIFGRYLRVWWQKLPPGKKELFLNKIRDNKIKISGFCALLIGSVVHYYVSHLEQDPVTKRRRFMAFSLEQITQIAEMELDAQIEVHKDMLLKPSHPQYVRVVKVANRILQANLDVGGIRDKNWSVLVVNHPTMKNAFVLPNGKIFIFIAMVELCENDDQLGIILAHEMSHALLCHMAEQLSNVLLIEWLCLIPLIIMWAVFPDVTALFSQWLISQVASLMFHLPFSRAIEMEADEFGLELAAKACFDVREASVLWSKMRLLELVEGEQSIEWLSTHPSHETRENIIDSKMQAALQLREKCNCPRLSGPDPREVFKAARKIIVIHKKADLTKSK